MPIKIQSDLPVKEILEKENIFVMDESRASHQDIRPIQILILNLMPLKEETELQLLRSLSDHRQLHWQKHSGQPLKPVLSDLRRCKRQKLRRTDHHRCSCGADGI